MSRFCSIPVRLNPEHRWLMSRNGSIKPGTFEFSTRGSFVTFRATEKKLDLPISYTHGRCRIALVMMKMFENKGRKFQFPVRIILCFRNIAASQDGQSSVSIT